MADGSIEAAIFGLLARREPGKTICPSEAARVLAGDDGDWRAGMPAVHAASLRLARAGRLMISQGGGPVDLDAFRGAYRLRLPAGGEER